MSDNLRVGDVVIIDIIPLKGFTGRIVTISEGGSVGIDFSEYYSPDQMEYYTHDLTGRLPGKTGRWYNSVNLKLKTKVSRKTGFGKFINKIESHNNVG